MNVTKVDYKNEYLKKVHDHKTDGYRHEYVYTFMNQSIYFNVHIYHISKDKNQVPTTKENIFKVSLMTGTEAHQSLRI